jgi:hypothetical protein
MINGTGNGGMLRAEKTRPPNMLSFSDDKAQESAKFLISGKKGRQIE